MKRRNLFFALAAGAMLFTACNSEEDIPAIGNEEGVQEIVLQVSNTGSGLQSRAGRPLYGSEAMQTIENVKVIVVQGKDVKYAETIDWSKEATPYTETGHGKEYKLTIPKDEHLSTGDYTIYAFGYHTGSEYSDLKTKIIDIKKGGEFNSNVVLNYTVDGNNAVAEEIFAGTNTFSVTAKGMSANVILNRQVAGTFGYFKHIPYVKGVKYLKLYAVNTNKTLVLGGFNSFDLTGNGKDNDGNINYVINGANAGTTADSKVIYTIDLNKWFTTIEDSKGLINEEYWQKGIEDSKVDFAKGSVFGGSFVIPFAKGTTPTFVLKMENKEGDELGSWTVKLPTSDRQLDAHNLATWGGSTFSTTTNTDSYTLYNVVRNHLYGIGYKGHDKDPDPDPEDPDDPQPLDNVQELTLRVNDNWEVIHRMELE